MSGEWEVKGEMRRGKWEVKGEIRREAGNGNGKIGSGWEMGSEERNGILKDLHVM